MRITISDDEFEAICFAEELINTSIEAGADDDFAHDASFQCNCLLNLIARLKEARKKERELETLYQLAKEMYPDESLGTWRKLARRSFAIQKATHSTQT